MEFTVEICCGSYYDALEAFKGGAKRIELNSALHLGGLTPTTATLDLVKKDTDLKVVSMVRPRAAGFCYNEADYKVMLMECKDLLDHGSDGIAFGFLKEDSTIDIERTKEFIALIKSYGKEVVFHRAFDCLKDYRQGIEILISLGVDRILTSGLANKAMDGIEVIKELQRDFGDKITLLAGSGINFSNAKTMITNSGISEVHSSCKAWLDDITTSTETLTYGYRQEGDINTYDVVSSQLVEKIIESVK